MSEYDVGGLRIVSTGSYQCSVHAAGVVVVPVKNRSDPLTYPIRSVKITQN